MLSAEQVLDTYFLDARCMLIELAALLDRLDASAAEGGGSASSDKRLAAIHASLRILADPATAHDRAERLLRLFSEPPEEALSQ